ncbi:MAG TPA: hypothetical protein EYQ50_19215 [Verrucomicrobiales bacterium]|nr:hypothetical protein [Verrucomicrobiales bacterium]
MIPRKFSKFTIRHAHGFEEHEGSHYLVMELVDGQDLSARLKSGPLPVEEALEVAKQIAEALETAHEKTVIHRDLKPGNIKFTTDGPATGRSSLSFIPSH